MLCTRRLLEVSDQISPVFLLLESSKNHLGARDVLLGVCEVDVQGVLAPGHALVLVSLGVGEPRRLASLSSPDPVEVGPLLVLAPSLDCVALGTRLGEDLLAIVGTHDCSGTYI